MLAASRVADSGYQDEKWAVRGQYRSARRWKSCALRSYYAPHLNSAAPEAGRAARRGRGSAGEDFGFNFGYMAAGRKKEEGYGSAARLVATAQSLAPVSPSKAISAPTPQRKASKTERKPARSSVVTRPRPKGISAYPKQMKPEDGPTRPTSPSESESESESGIGNRHRTNKTRNPKTNASPPTRKRIPPTHPDVTPSSSFPFEFGFGETSGTGEQGRQVSDGETRVDNGTDLAEWRASGKALPSPSCHPSPKRKRRKKPAVLAPSIINVDRSDNEGEDAPPSPAVSGVVSAGGASAPSSAVLSSRCSTTPRPRNLDSQRVPASPLHPPLSHTRGSRTSLADRPHTYGPASCAHKQERRIHNRDRREHTLSAPPTCLHTAPRDPHAPHADVQSRIHTHKSRPPHRNKTDEPRRAELSKKKRRKTKGTQKYAGESRAAGVKMRIEKRNKEGNS
ncbi:hypothetical protein K438DRAFT_1753403 [Mycena galopus ATCC 62051]|nr:hypothetical protein K438DRAFT_1753403 [Mycena galopus ATCC 62051]